MPNNDITKIQKESTGEALNEPDEDNGWGDEDEEEVVESPVIVESKYEPEIIDMANNYNVKGFGAASHDVEIEGREEYQLKQSFGI